MNKFYLSMAVLISTASLSANNFSMPSWGNNNSNGSNWSMPSMNWNNGNGYNTSSNNGSNWSMPNMNFGNNNNKSGGFDNGSNWNMPSMNFGNGFGNNNNGNSSNWNIPSMNWGNGNNGSNWSMPNFNWNNNNQPFNVGNNNYARVPTTNHAMPRAQINTPYRAAPIAPRPPQFIPRVSMPAQAQQPQTIAPKATIKFTPSAPLQVPARTQKNAPQSRAMNAIKAASTHIPMPSEVKGVILAPENQAK
ncbi:MAG TPA: hypothetical protein EYG71_07785 [Leucothrix sp.]|nr:hypothetical protein [Leucothrix sp.]